LIRIVGDKFPGSVKKAIVEALLSLLVRGGGWVPWDPMGFDQVSSLKRNSPDMPHVLTLLYFYYIGR
jgi:hypothetical protein